MEKSKKSYFEGSPPLLLLVDDLRKSGVTLRLVGSNLSCRSPKDAFTPELKERVKNLKPQLIELFKSTDLAYWIALAANATTLLELKSILEEFGTHNFFITDQAKVIDAYLPTAKRLIESEGADKYRTLEDLAAIAWRNKSNDGSI